MSVDITPLILEAQARPVTSFPIRLSDLLSDFALQGLDIQVDWDSDAGERWAKLEGANVTTYLWTFAPLSILLGTMGSYPIQQRYFALLRRGYSIIMTDDWDGERYTMSKTTAESFFFNGERVNTVLDTTSFSLHDLWWATV